METLLEKAKKVKTVRVTHSYSKEDIELVCAWVKGQITTNQLSIVKFGRKCNSSTYSFITISLKKAFENGVIKIIN